MSKTMTAWKAAPLALALILGGVPVLAGEPAPAGEEEALVQYNLRVDGMTCPFCAANAEATLRAMKGVRMVHTHLEGGVVHVCATDDARLDDEELKALFLDKGFTYRGKEKVGACPLKPGMAGMN